MAELRECRRLICYQPKLPFDRFGMLRDSHDAAKARARSKGLAVLFRLSRRGADLQRPDRGPWPVQNLSERLKSYAKPSGNAGESAEPHKPFGRIHTQAELQQAIDGRLRTPQAHHPTPA